MTPSDHTARRATPHGPKRRSDTTRPTSTRYGRDRRPYPTAPTTTRLSPAKPGSVSTGPRPRGAAAKTSPPTPATVWTAGASPIDLDVTWPVPIITKIVGSFSEPRSRIALLPWPTPPSTRGERRRLGVVGANDVINRAPIVDPDDELVAAVAAIDSLDRSAHVVRVAADANLADSEPGAFWADLVGDDRNRLPVSALSLSGSRDGVFDDPDADSADTDLVITSLRPGHARSDAIDLVALIAAQLLRVGGILGVLTHCDSPLGELIDPTGAVVTAAQNADLLYLQHIVALHAPIRDGRFATELISEADPSAAETQARARHRAAVRGLPAPHRRIHSDVLVFAQPHERQPLAMSLAVQVSETGVIR